MSHYLGLPVAGYRPQDDNAIGRTQIEQGFMAVNRAVFKPGRIDLTLDEQGR